VCSSDLLTLNTLEYYQNISSLYRQPKKTELIRALYDVHDQPFVSQELSHKRRLELGLPVGVPVILTIGHNDYFRPSQGVDFFQTLSEILEQSPSTHALIVGPNGREEYAQHYILHPRIRFVGPVLDAIPYYQAADIVLESFPQPSLGAFLEAVGYGGCYPVPAYASRQNIYSVDLPVIKDLVTRTNNIGSYVQHTVEVLADITSCREQRMSRQKCYRDYCENRPWKIEFERIYSAVQGMEHAPAKLVPPVVNIDVDSMLLARNDIKGPVEVIMNGLSRQDMLTVVLKGLREMDTKGRIATITEVSFLIFNRIKRRLNL
jgi:glycosyltransferase involved in cell wall biosynthesis